MKSITPLVTDIEHFLTQFSGKEKLINLYNIYNSNNPVSRTYFIAIVSSKYSTFTIGKTIYIDFDEPLVI